MVCIPAACGVAQSCAVPRCVVVMCRSGAVLRDVVYIINETCIL